MTPSKILLEAELDDFDPAEAHFTPPPPAVVQEQQPAPAPRAKRGRKPDTRQLVPGTLLDPSLAFAAAVVDDLEKVRIAEENRLRQLTRSEADSDGEERGFGLTLDHPEVKALAEIVDQLTRLEKNAVKNLERKLKGHPLYPWIQKQKGIGEKQAARLLAAIDDPYINNATEKPRGLYSLWAYCGFHVLPAGQDTSDSPEGSVPAGSSFTTDPKAPGSGVAPRRRRGQRANWSATAKMRAYLIAESCIKVRRPECKEGHVDDCGCSAYRLMYERRRAHTAVTRPDFTDGHSHNDALRVVAKEVLRGLWVAAHDWHQKQEKSR